MLCAVLSTALARRGFDVVACRDVASALAAIDEEPPEYAVLDLKLRDGSGLDLIGRLRAARQFVRIVILTGYASIPTAVESIKLGATHYLAKPADADDIVQAFGRTEGRTDTPMPDEPPSVNRVEWEHIQRVLAAHDGNISATARALRMHRRTLQRKLDKHAPRH